MAGITAGSGLYISTNLVPLIQRAPAVVGFRQWDETYTSGAKSFPVFTLLQSVLFGLTSYNLKSVGSPSWALLAIASGMSVAIVPFTLLFMMKSIKNLKDHGKFLEAEPKDLVSVSKFHELIKSWSRLHMVRAFLMVGSFGVSLFSLV